MGRIFSRGALFAMVYQYKLYAKVADISCSTKKGVLGDLCITLHCVIIMLPSLDHFTGIIFITLVMRSLMNKINE